MTNNVTKKFSKGYQHGVRKKDKERQGKMARKEMHDTYHKGAPNINRLSRN